MIRFLKLLSNVVSPDWWAEVLGNKLGLYKLAEQPNRFKTWKLNQPLWKQAFIEVFMFTIIALAFEPLLNMMGYSMLPWRWF